MSRLHAALVGIGALGEADHHDAVEISEGVWMPLINLGAVSSKPSNFTSWLALGGRGVDTALMYGDDIQQEVGEAVRASDVARSDIFVTTKVPCDPYVPDRTTGDFAKDVEHTFEVLGIPHVDLFLLHNACRDRNGKLNVTATAAAYSILEPLVAQGRARAIGVSNFDANDLDLLLPQITVAPAVNQDLFSIGKHDDETLHRCAELNITYSAYSPLGGLSHVDVLHDPDVLAVAQAHNKSAAQVALRWVAQQGVVAVTATDKVSHQMSDLAIFDFELSRDEMEKLRAVGVTSAQSEGRVVASLPSVV